MIEEIIKVGDTVKNENGKLGVFIRFLCCSRMEVYKVSKTLKGKLKQSKRKDIFLSAEKVRDFDKIIINKK